MYSVNQRHLATEASKETGSILNINEEAARHSILRLISLQLNAVGFSHVEHISVIEDIDGLVNSFMDGIVHVAYEMAQLCRRSRPNVRDMIAACADQGIEIQDLNELLEFELPKDVNFKLAAKKTMNWSDPTLDFLPSDQESDDEDQDGNNNNERQKNDSILVDSNTKRKRPNSERIGGLPFLPNLPARHSWRRSTLKPNLATVLPPKHLSPPSATPPQIPNLLHPDFIQTDENESNTPACLGFLNQQIRATRMVEKSLTNLVQPHSLISPKFQSFSKIHPLKSDESVEKFQISENDVPIINFERDWYDNRIYPSNLITDQNDQDQVKISSS